ncbi:MAG: TetR/AcrR family transcriptional regulator, partial [Leptospiraceae bacterium]|nr:TetR/AcrR family transcriptional regulator [Leptospiraceae bacterium]
DRSYSPALQRWLDAGLEILYRPVPAGLTIEALCERLGLSKGSFYHHFKNREEYSARLLDYWEQENTLRVIELSRSSGDAREQIRSLTLQVIGLAQNTEIAVRAWAQVDSLAREYVRRVDRKRRDYVAQLCSEFTSDAAEARLLAHMLYSVYIGSRFIIPPLKEKEIRGIFKLLEDFTTGR